MDIQQLRYVSALAREQNFSKAAAALYITQPTLSQQIRRLEDELGLTLFTRTTRTVSLTAAGQVFLAEASKVLLDWQRLLDQMEAQKQVAERRLRLGLLNVSHSLDLPRHITAFVTAYPHFSVDLVGGNTKELMEMLHLGTVDAAIVKRSPDTVTAADALTYTTLLPDTLYLMLPKNHMLSMRKSVTLREIHALGQLALPRDTVLYQIISEHLAAEGLTMDVVYDSMQSLDILMGLVQNGACVSILSGTVGRWYATHEGVVLVPIVPALSNHTVLAVAPGKEKNAAVQALRDFLVEALNI